MNYLDRAEAGGDCCGELSRERRRADFTSLRGILRAGHDRPQWAVVTHIAPEGMVGVTAGYSVWRLTWPVSARGWQSVSLSAPPNHSYEPSLKSVQSLIGVFSYIFLLGNVERIALVSRP